MSVRGQPRSHEGSAVTGAPGRSPAASATTCGYGLWTCHSQRHPAPRLESAKYFGSGLATAGALSGMCCGCAAVARGRMLEYVRPLLSGSESVRVGFRNSTSAENNEPKSV